MREVLDAVLEWIPTWETDPENALPRRAGDRQRRRDPGRLRLARLAHAAPHRPLPRRPRPADEADGGRARPGARDGARLARRFPDYGVEAEVYVTAPGAEIDEGHPLVGGARRRARAGVRRAAGAGRHALVLGRVRADRAGIPTVNYGTSTGLLDTTDGENLDIDGLVRTAHVYALAAMAVCGVAG